MPPRGTHVGKADDPNSLIDTFQHCYNTPDLTSRRPWRKEPCTLLFCQAKENVRLLDVLSADKGFTFGQKLV